MIQFYAVAPIVLALLLPVPESDPFPGTMDCNCTLAGIDVGSFTGGSYPTVDVTYGAGWRNGACEGTEDECPQVLNCFGKVNINVVDKAFTSFTLYPGVWGVDISNQFDFTRTLDNCGQTRSMRVTVWNNVTHLSLGDVTLWIFCTWCSNSTGDA